jgi:hypothetical protein
MATKNTWKPQWRIDKEVKDQKQREAAAELAKGLVDNDSNFPKLSTVAVNNVAWVGKPTFKEIVSIPKEPEQIVEEVREIPIGAYQTNNFVFALPRFKSTYRRHEEDEQEEEVSEEPTQSEWTLVDRTKVRKPKNMEEIANRPPTPDEDGTVWEKNEVNETCWEERR